MHLTERTFRASPLSTDKPFITRAQPWGRNASGVCVPIAGTHHTYMVGIKRGTTMYVDRDGNGTWNSTTGCDLSGTFGLSSDAPFAERLGVWGTTRISGSTLYWFFDVNKNLVWDSGDVTSTNFGATTDCIPASHPGGVSVQRGRTVYYDTDGNRGWSSGDSTFTNVLPSTSWKLVGTYTYTPILW